MLKQVSVHQDSVNRLEIELLQKYISKEKVKKSEELAKACERRLSLQKYGTEMPWSSKASRKKAQDTLKAKAYRK